MPEKKYLSGTFAEVFMARRRNANQIERMAPTIKEDWKQIKIYDNDNLPQQQKTDALAQLLLSYKVWLKNKFKDVVQ